MRIEIQRTLGRRKPRILVPKSRRRRLIVGGAVALLLILVAWGLGLFSPSHQAIGRAVERQRAAGEEVDTPLEGPEAARRCVEWLNAGIAYLEGVQDFHATFHRQERLGGRLGEAEVMHIKMRREPRAVFLSWIEPFAGRELVWHQEAYEGKLLIHECGWKGNLVPIVKLSPSHPLVLASGRRGISELGLWSLAQLLAKHSKYLESPDVAVELTVDKSIGDRPCYTFSIVFPEDSGIGYHQAILYLDKEWKFPLGCEIYDAPTEGGEAPLLEAYYYEELELNVGLVESEFDPANPNYHFGKGPASSQIP